MSNNAGMLAYRMAAGYVIGSNNRRARDRRAKNIGQDQLLLKVKADKFKVGDSIADCFDNLEYYAGFLRYRNKVRYDFFAFGLSYLVICLALVLLYLLIFDDVYLHNILYIIFISVLPSYCIGYCAYDDKYEHIKIMLKEKYVYVLLQIYNGDGYRNLDEDKIEDIIESLENLYKKENEVRKSIKSR